MQESNFNVIIDTENYNAVIGESAKIDVGQAISNVQSGKAEIEAAVQDGKAAFNLNATAKTNAFNQNAIDKTGVFDSNATAKTGDFDTNATNKTTAFDNNYTAKLGAFNDNAATKQAEVDASAALVKQYAIGDPSEPIGNSAKYWAEQAASSVTGLGARVTAIEGKIPADASSSNQLADKDWVGNQGYITGITSGDVTTALGYTPYNSTNPDGYITGITSGDVTTALGYTPYDASNPSGYTSNVGTVTSVNNTSPDGSGNVTITIPNPLPSQTGNSGKFLTTDGTDASWAAVSTRNIGEIVQSTIPLTDAGLHLLDGALLQGSGAYGDFVTYIAGLVSDYPDLFETEANWQQSVTDYGVCGKFVYDSVNGTVRLPKIIGFTESTIDATVLGDLVEAGLPNITGSITEMMSRNQTITATGALSTGTVTVFKPSSGNYNLGHADISIDASASSSIYGNSTTVQPQAIKVLYYIIIANSTKTQIEVDIDEIMTDLNGKADTDLSNVGNSGTALSAGWAMPSDTYDDLTLGASDASYQAPASGWYNVLVVAGGAGKFIDVKNPTTGMASRSISHQSTDWIGANLPVRKGDTIQIAYNSTGAVKNFRFIYAVGSESEAQNV